MDFKCFQGSDDESMAETKSELKIRLQPLLSICVTQPYMMLSLTNSSHKLDMSVYNMTVATAPPAYHLPAKSGKKVPWQRDFPLFLIETKPGEPDNKSGISPSLISVSFSDIISDSVSISCKISRPILLAAGEERISQMVKFYNEIAPFLQSHEKDKMISKDVKVNRGFLIKDVNVDSSQILCRYEWKINNVPYTIKANIGETKIIGSFKNHLDLLPTELKMSFERVAIVSIFNHLPHPILDPCNINITTTKPLLGGSFSNNYNIQVKGNHCSLHCGPNIIHFLEALKVHSKEVLKKFSGRDASHDSEDLHHDDFVDEVEVDETHFQDDLRAGAFQFVDVNAGNEQPAPYQVVFGRNTMTWKYPQRRTLTKAVIFPLPFLDASEVSPDLEDGVECELLYWSDGLQHFVVYQSFQLSETRVIHLDLPLVSDRRLCCSSDTWQVRINRFGDQAFISPQALVSVMKIDSFSSPRLLPQSQCAVSFSSLKIVLHNHLQYAGRKMTGDLADLALDDQMPADQPMLSLSLSPVSLGVSSWPCERSDQLIQTSLKTRISVEFVDYCFLGVHHLIKPADVDVWLQYQESQMDVTAKFGTIDAAVGPFFIHTFRQSTSIWQQVLDTLNKSSSKSEIKEEILIPLAHLMIINETGQVVKFGQADTEEEIMLQPKHVTMYCWRTNKTSQKLRLCLGVQDWSESFSVNSEGSRLITTNSNNSSCSSIIVEVEKKCTTLTVVKFSGLLNILNLLKDHLELR